MNIESLFPINPATLRNRNEEELLQILASSSQDSAWPIWVNAELTRRQTERLSESLSHVENAVFQVERAVKSLTTSSEHLEGLTKRLKTLTWALIFITILAGAVPIGIEVWKAYHSEPLPHLQETSPQTPVPLMP